MSVTTVYASMVDRDTGQDVTAGISVSIIKDGGIQTPGVGTLEHEGNGQWSYKPTAEELNNVRSLGILFFGNNTIPQTINVFTTPPPISLTPKEAQAIGLTVYQSNYDLDEYFHNERLDSDLWFLLDDDTKTKLSIQATRIIDNLNYSCDKTDPEQALEFPRNGGTEVPKDILIAHAEICFALADGVNLEYEAEQLTETNITLGMGKIWVNPLEYNLAKLHGIPSFVAWRHLKKYLRRADAFTIVRV